MRHQYWWRTTYLSLCQLAVSTGSKLVCIVSSWPKPFITWTSIYGVRPVPDRPGTVSACKGGALTQEAQTNIG
ncbi:hypothetical protein F5Y11DRAFT_330966 [Daldinia sp. FL1419]|nr:hypothetical protein F5Y11DRAFT_330966 [Daldinia sp. FL1419]